MVNIELKLFVTLAKYLPNTKTSYQVEQGTTVGELIGILGIPEDLVKLIFINNIRSKRDAVLKNNDRVGMFPPVGGG